MTGIETETIPYEKQSDPQNGRTCGAACLSMIYRSFKLEASQGEVWPKVAKYNRLGTMASSTHLMVQDAVIRGLVAVAIQATHPLQVLRRCHENGVRVILNHRLKEDLATGHYSVLVDIDAENVILHDPYFGPARRVPHTELLDLLRPRYLNAEIAGNVLIGIAAKSPPIEACPLCRTPFPHHVDCPKCEKPVPLEPSIVLGCVNTGCDARLWNHVCCLYCDHTWSFGPGFRQGQAPTEFREISVDYTPVFEQLDKVVEHVLSLGAVANHPDIRQQLEILKAGKEELKLAQNEEVLRGKLRRAELARLEEKRQQQVEAVAKKQEEVNLPAAPLDGNVLGQTIVRELGLLGAPSQQSSGEPVQATPARTNDEFVKMLRKRGHIP